MEHQNQPGFYQTGYTQPPKSHNGIIAFLLIVIVLLGSVATVLGLLNIKLFQKLSMQSETGAPVEFVQLAKSTGGSTNALGISVKTLTSFDQKIYHLPQGVYITEVASGSSAASQGIVPGDILISIENVPVTDADTLNTYLSACNPQQPLKAVIFRSGRLYKVMLTLGG